MRTATGPEWVDALTHLADPRRTGYVLQLDNAAAAFAGAEHSMPGFAQALSVQERVEAILAAG
ncbi:MAG: hypothetical protein H6982_09565 [Chromatiales bacterium]|nr:hypothetical protein [Chromatiales bacterium]